MNVYPLRSDLRVIERAGRDGTNAYLIEDPLSGNVFSLREEEKFLCDQLGSSADLEELQGRFTERFGSALERKQLESFIYQLGEKGLLDGYAVAPPSLWESFQFQSAETWKRWRLFNADGLLLRLGRAFGWCYTPWFVALTAGILLLAVGTAAFNFPALVKDLKLLVQPYTIVQMFVLMYLFVNIPGELARGMTAARFGSYGTECGVWLAYNVMPRFYCLSSVWEIKDKSRRSWTLFAPSFYAVLVGSLGIIVWKTAPGGTALHSLGLAIAFLCALDTMIRLNVIWPNEAHYLLSNMLELENFRKRSLRVLKSVLLFRPLPEPLTGRDKGILLSYGLLTALATFPSVVALVYFGGKFLITTLGGTGGLIVLGVISLKYRRSISRIIKESPMLQWVNGKSTKRGLKRKVLTGVWLVVVIIIMLLPYPFEAGGPFKLMPLERVELHAVVPGEIKSVQVKENSLVKKGEVQAYIDTSEHQKNVDVTRADLDKARADLKLLEKGPKPEEVRKAEEQVMTAKTQADYSRKEEVRLKELYKEGVISQEEYDAAAAKADVDARTLDVAKANLQLVKSGARPEEIEAQKAVIKDLEAKLKYYDQNLGLTRLAAPISGRVVTPYVDMKVGQVLKEGDLFAVYESSDEIQAEIQLPEADIAEVKVGAKVKIRPEAYPTQFFYGTVSLIAPKAEETPNGKIVRVVTKLPNSDQALRPEMTGEAKIEGGSKPVIVAFTRAIVRFFMVEVWSWFP